MMMFRWTCGALLTLVVVVAATAGPDAEPVREKPAPLDLLVVAPHSDDEAIGCTIVMLEALARKERVGVVVVTSGDAFEGVTAVAKKTKDKLVPADYIKLAGARQQHTIGAMGRIGIRPADLMFLGYPDGGLDKIYQMKGKEPFQHPFTQKKETYGPVARDYHSQVHGRPGAYTKAEVLGDLQEIIKVRQPKEIYVTDEADSHGDHRAAFWFVRDAARAAKFQGKLFTYVVHGKGPKERPGRVITLSKEQFNRKKAVIEEYQAGMSPFHDKLAETYTKPEESFWLIRLD
jgi:LmbE family N-acetylglucosaminyl deacetylase